MKVIVYWASFKDAPQPLLSASSCSQDGNFTGGRGSCAPKAEMAFTTLPLITPWDFRPGMLGLGFNWVQVRSEAVSPQIFFKEGCAW